MNTRDLLIQYRNHPIIKEIRIYIENRGNSAILHGLTGSSFSLAMAAISDVLPLLIICSDEETAGLLKNDLDTWLGDNHTGWLGSSYRKALDPDSIDSNLVQERAELLLALTEKKGPGVMVTWLEALAEKAIDKETLQKSQFEIRSGTALDLDFLLEMLDAFHFVREDFVYEPGQFAIRGGIIDIFSFSHEYPYRIELNGSLIESMRFFDPVSQLSRQEILLAGIVPDITLQNQSSERISLFEYLATNTCFVLPQAQISFGQYLKLYEEAQQKSSELVVPGFESPMELRSKLSGSTLLMSPSGEFEAEKTFEFRTKPQPVFNRQFQWISTHLQELADQKTDCLIFSETSRQIERLYAIFEDMGSTPPFAPVYKSLSAGFIDPDLNIALYTEHELFGRNISYRNKSRYSKNQALTLKELANLSPGDIVVHVDHGIGKFQGLQKLENNGKIQEAVRIMYKNGDLLYVNIQSLHKISKYTGKEGTEPVLNKLGSDAWQTLKTKTKKQVKDIARDLIKLYAARKAQPGFSYAPDSYLQLELEASFIYEDTPDQSKATEDIKRDMESPHPMDRLVCGDVGFGKTEVAIRAAFKAVCDSRQVAVLVPTTILAQQHYRTFKSRLEGFPVQVDYLNRFRTAKHQKETLAKLKEGKVDIVIGTHRLLGKDIDFKNLGLLIIDEEQKFGVGAKEKLKQLRVNVDTLTLTATPIPRTLHFSLMGARDLSIINTPPPNRQPVHTSVQVFNKEILSEAVNRELDRGGQVFIVHNRVKDIEDLANLVRSCSKGSRVAVAHGQMHGDDLENIMVKFVEGEFDVLVATTIIESGLDIPNANTIIINNAHFFGLSDLHQMRGRVGRSNRKAYCYLFCPPLHSLTDEARRRLVAIEEFSDLGSGFNVAMRDLDIRGAGNLLGAEQSGFIAEIGFDMYHKILDESIQELKQEEFSDVFEDQDLTPVSVDCQVETDIEAMIPDEYVRNISERLNLYTELSRIRESDELEAFKRRLKDRFGMLPRQVERLLDLVRVKWLAESIGVEKLIFKKEQMLAQFTTKDSFFTSELFGHLVAVIQKNSHVLRLKQGKTHLVLMADKVSDISAVLNLLYRLKPEMNLSQESGS